MSEKLPKKQLTSRFERAGQGYTLMPSTN